MGNKTIYVSEKDESLFDQAKEIAGEALSSVIVRALKEYVNRHAKKDKDMHEVSIKIGSHDNEREQRFIGTKIGKWSGFSDDKVWLQEAVIYRTQKNNWAVLLTTVSKATLLTNPKLWKVSGDYLINVKRSELHVAVKPEELKKKLPQDLYDAFVDLAKKDENPVEYLDI